MEKEIIRIERKILRHCLIKMKRWDLVDSIDYFSDREIHEMYLIICQKFKEV